MSERAVVLVPTTSSRTSEKFFHDSLVRESQESVPNALLNMLLRVLTRFHKLFLNLRNRNNNQ